MDWHEDSDAVIDLLNNLEQGDRVRIVADEAVAGDGGFARGDATLIDDTGTVVDEGEYATSVEFDETVIEYADDSHEATTFDVQGEQIVADWDSVGDSDDDSAFHRGPANSTVAMLREIERVDE